jgi:acyl-CoA thioester hydrolase
MFAHQIEVRVRYGETDQMGFVYFEVARVESFRHIGFSYKEMEAAGILMPVLEYKSRYIKPALYDDLLTIKVFIKEKPAIRIKFEYEVYNEATVLLNAAETTLVFFNKFTNKPCLPSPIFNNMLQQYF